MDIAKYFTLKPKESVPDSDRITQGLAIASNPEFTRYLEELYADTFARMADQVAKEDTVQTAKARGELEAISTIYEYFKSMKAQKEDEAERLTERLKDLDDDTNSLSDFAQIEP